MFQAIRSHADRQEEDGFTLIELMVVVLIIGILLAIAIPTFLGARNRASDRSAQSNLRNGLTAEKTLYTDNQSYTTSATALAGVEPSLSWVTAVSPTNSRAVVTTVFDSATTVVLEDQSATGTCFYIGDVAGTNSTSPGVGTYYMKDTSCGAATDPVAQGSITPGSTTSSVANATWAAAF